MSKKMNKPMIKYLEIDENSYIENDVIKMKLNENYVPKEGSWDELWEGVIEIMKKIQKYDEIHNKSGNC